MSNIRYRGPGVNNKDDTPREGTPPGRKSPKKTKCDQPAGVREKKCDQPAGVREKRAQDKSTKSFRIGPGTYWLTRIVVLRSLSFLYFIAFLIALNQNIQLIGKNGLLPADLHLARVKDSVGGNVTSDLVYSVPTVMWFLDWRHFDNYLYLIALVGCGLSMCVMVSGCANMLIMSSLWVLYHSLVNIGQRWYSFGWESQLLESGFLAIFLCPVLTLRQIPRKTPPSLVVMWGYRWLIFRIMIGAGMIKVRGDQCWRDLTCMNYHYETQPVPNPMSYYLHQSPEIFHKFETGMNHFIELMAPVLLMVPWYRWAPMIGGFLQIIFQVVLIISGNLSFLNWLTILPSLCCFDDAFYSRLFSTRPGSVLHSVYKIQTQTSQDSRVSALRWFSLRRLTDLCLTVLIVVLSVPVVQNLFSQRQRMNTSFDPLRLVNTYGAFGSITKERTEIIFDGTNHTDPYSGAAVWLEYEFKCKPGRVDRRPCIISPYHYRLDWLMWFAAFQRYQMNNWLVHLAAKFLTNDPVGTSLIEHNPFEHTNPPRFIRATHYMYTYTELGSDEARSGNWWHRERLGLYLPVLSLKDLRPYAKKFGWIIPSVSKIDKQQY